jgi:hypothetical protein
MMWLIVHFVLKICLLFVLDAENGLIETLPIFLATIPIARLVEVILCAALIVVNLHHKILHIGMKIIGFANLAIRAIFQFVMNVVNGFIIVSLGVILTIICFVTNVLMPFVGHVMNVE